MDTLENMKNAVAYIEDNLDGTIEYPKIAQIALCSQFHFQRMFVFVVGVPLSEYIRRRRMTLAAMDLQNSDDKVIDIALRYGYSSSDTFSRAFQSIHGVLPSQARQKGIVLKVYPRVSFSITLKGVEEMQHRIVEKDPFRIVGITERLPQATLGAEVGRMWSQVSGDTMQAISGLMDVEPQGIVGAYAGMYDDSTTDYYIGAITTKGAPEGLTLLEVPAATWAIFECVGALPKAMSDVWGRIFTEWFPTTGYEHAEAPEVEWYSSGDMSSDTYRSEIWIPVIKK